MAFHEVTSRERGGKVLSVVLAGLFVLIYLFVFPRGLGKEFFIVPTQVVPIQPLAAEKLPQGGSFFHLGDWEGYWGPDGKLARARPARPNLQITTDRVAFYNSDLDQVEVEGLNGPLFQIPGEKYPYWAHDRLFLIGENRMGLSEVSSDGKSLWSRKLASLMTAMDASANLLSLGTLDGKVQVFNRQGELKSSFAPGGSRLPVIYNTKISNDEKRILLLAGVDPKRFVLLEKGGNDFRPVFHKPLEEKSRRPTPLGFLDQNRFAYYQSSKGVTVIDTQNTTEERTVTFEGELLDLNWLGDHQLIVLLAKQQNGNVLRFDSLEGTTIFQTSFQAKDVLIQKLGKNYVLGIDQNLLLLELKEE